MGSVAFAAAAPSSSLSADEADESVAAANAICDPSGLHTGAPAPSGSFVSCSGSPPSAGSSHTCPGPSSARRNAIAEPSGDHAGEVSDWPHVSRRGPRSSPTETHQSERTARSASASAVRSTYAQVRASGASAGCSGTASSSRSSIRRAQACADSLSRSTNAFGRRSQTPPAELVWTHHARPIRAWNHRADGAHAARGHAASGPICANVLPSGARRSRTGRRRRSARSTRFRSSKPASSLIERIWDDGEPKAPTTLLRALSHAGQLRGRRIDDQRARRRVASAFSASMDAEVHLHSHITGVDPRLPGPVRRLRAEAVPAVVGARAGASPPLVDRRSARARERVLQPREARRVDRRRTTTTSTACSHDRLNAGGASDRAVVRWELISDRSVAGGVAAPPRHPSLGDGTRDPPARPPRPARVGTRRARGDPPSPGSLRTSSRSVRPTPAARARGGRRAARHDRPRARGRLPRRRDHAGRLARAHPMRLDAVELRPRPAPAGRAVQDVVRHERERDVLLVHVARRRRGGLGRVRRVRRAVLLGGVRRRRAGRHPRATCSRGSSRGDDVAAEDVAALLAPVRGHPMAKAALEMAILDAELRATGRLARRVPRRGHASASTAACPSGSTTTSPTCCARSSGTSPRATGGSS